MHEINLKKCYYFMFTAAIFGDILKKITKNLYTSLCSLMSSKKIYTYLIIKKKTVAPIDPLKKNIFQKICNPAIPDTIIL